MKLKNSKLDIITYS